MVGTSKDPRDPPAKVCWIRTLPNVSLTASPLSSPRTINAFDLFPPVQQAPVTTQTPITVHVITKTTGSLVLIRTCVCRT